MREFLTVILFKDHLTSRTLRMPLSWLPRLGLVWLTVMLLTVLVAGLFFRALLKTHGGSGTIATLAAEDQIHDLEQQLNELKASYDALLARAEGRILLDRPTGSREANFLALPATSTRSRLPPKESLPIRMGALQAQWKGGSLQISTSIEYIREDGGNQQGTLVILARGPQHIYAHPEGTLNPAGADSMIKPESGEYFSVSRFREVRAAFGPIPVRESVKSIEIFIFNVDRSLIFYDLIGVDAPKAKPSSLEQPSAAVKAPAPRETAKPQGATKAAAPPLDEIVPSSTPLPEGERAKQ